jgi:hypothetical protein
MTGSFMTFSRPAGVSPQNPHKSASAAAIPTEIPWTKRHYPAQDGTGASMALLALTSLYAGSAGLTSITAPVVRAATDLLKAVAHGGPWLTLTKTISGASGESSRGNRVEARTEAHCRE